MLGKRIGEPCPACSKPLIRRASKFRSIRGDVAFCARCDAAWELAETPADRRCVRAAG